MIAVADRRARCHKADAVTVIAALPDDLVEDSHGTAEEIAGRFGARVAALVRKEVTDDTALPRQARKAGRVQSSASKIVGAKRIKLADRAAHVTAWVESPPVGWDGRGASPVWTGPGR